jgi:glucosyl-dolichyl phosphate glucuronosyltransferase
VSRSYSVVICAYTLERWDLLRGAVDSARDQRLRPREIIVCVDHNAELAERARQAWASQAEVRVIQNRFPGRLGSARNSALEIASGEVIAFLDDDAQADPGWLQLLDGVYGSSTTIWAVGGSPRPRYEVPRPPWFPFEFDWVFGCAYRGLPDERGPVGRLIGASMSVRRAAALKVGGFHSDAHDDMDLSHRLVAEFGRGSVMYDPEIQVSHFVSRQRLSWSYFWRRCFHVNRGKVLAFKDMAHAGNQNADFAFVRQALLRALPRYLVTPSSGGWARAAALLAGIALAGFGNIVGRLGVLFGRTEPSLTRGLPESSGVAAS